MKPTHRTPSPRLRPVALAAASALGLLGLPLQAAGPAPTALPTGLAVVHGQAQVSTATQGALTQMTVRNSAGAILNWASFDIGAQAGVHFQQVDAASKVLNRVTGSDPSAIFGSLTSNGQVWLLNPNGVLFGAGARVDVAGLVASTLRLDDNAFLEGLRSGRFVFTDGRIGATVRNDGALRSAHGGHVLLLSDRVENAGTIDTPGGALRMAGTKSATLVDSALPHLAAVVPSGEVLNLGRAAADGGVVDVYAGVVNQQGLVRADTLALDAQGRVVLKAADTLMLAGGSTTQAAGTAAGTAGGRIDLLGAQVGLVGQAVVDASGDAGGGAVRVGGGLMGQDRSVDNARAVYIGPGVTLRADATGEAGTGGSLIVWSDEATRAYGRFSARGGRKAGDGGFIETSGGWLDARPAGIDVTAPGGAAGTWLIDPNNLTISDTGPDAAITGGPSFTTTGDNAVITTATIAAALNAGNSVTLTTAAVGGNQPGDILMVGANLLVAPPTAVTLTLNATRDIVVQNSVLASTGASLNLDFRAAGNDAFGVVSISSSSITTAGGNVTLGGSVERQLPLPGGGLTSATFRPARGYSANVGGPSSALGAGSDAVRLDSSVFELGAGTFRAVGESAVDSSDAVLIRSDAGTPMRINAAQVQIIGHAPAPTAVDGDRIGVIIGGQNTDITVGQFMLLQGAGDGGVSLENGARLVLSSGGSSITISGRGGARQGLVLTSYDPDTLAPGRGSRITLAGGSLGLTGSSTFGTEAVLLDNSVGAPGPLLDLASASGNPVIQGQGAGADVAIVGVDIVPPLAGTLFLSTPSRLSLSEVFVSGAGGAVRLQSGGTAIDNSVFSSTAAPLSLDFVSANSAPSGVSLNNTIIETRGGNVTFGDLRTVSSTILGATTVPDYWLETDSTDSLAALSISDTAIDAGSGLIRGGGAVRDGGVNAAGLVVFRSVLEASRIELAGRSNALEGVVADEATLRAGRVLRLGGLSASNSPLSAFGVRVGERSLLQVLDPTNDAGSVFSLAGTQLADGIGVLVEGGAVGSGNETRITLEGVDATLSGTSGSGSGLVLRGSAAASGGVLVSAAPARTLRLEGEVTLDAATGGTGTGLQLFHARLIGPQLSQTAPLEITANGGGAGGAGLKLEFSNISNGGVTTIAGNSILVTNSQLIGDGSINLYAVDAGASAGSIVINQSVLQTALPTARVFAGTRTGGPALGVAGIAGGAGVQVTDSQLEASDAGGVVELRGTGAATGGRGVEFFRSPLTATTLTLVGRGTFDGDGVFSDDLSSSLSTLTTRNLTIDGLAAHNPTATQLTRAGIVLGRGVQLSLGVGGTVLLTGDLISLGRSGSMTGTGGTAFLAAGAPASVTVSATRSMQLRDAILDFTDGPGTAVSLLADTDGIDGGRVRMNTGSAILSGGGDITLSGRGSAAATTPPGAVPLATVVQEGAIGVYFSGGLVDAGAGNVVATGNTWDFGNGAAAEPSMAGLGFLLAPSTVRGNVITLTGSTVSSGFGVTIGDPAASVGHLLQGNQIVVNGNGVGTTVATGEAAPGVRLFGGAALLATNSITLNGTTSSGVQLSDVTLTSGGSLGVTGSGPVIVNGATALTAAGALSLVGVGTPAAAPAVAQPGLLLGAGVNAQGGTVTLQATQAAGSTALALLAAAGTGSVQATAGDLLISAGTDPAAGPVAVTGGWSLGATGTVAITSPQRLALDTSVSGLLSPTFIAPAVSITIAGSQPLAFAGLGSALDLSLLGTGLAGLAPGSTVELRAQGAPVVLTGSLAVPGRLRLFSDGLTLEADSQLAAAAAGDAIVIGGDSTPGLAFVNDAGASALSTPAGRWVLLADNPATTVLGGLAPGFLAYGLGSTPWSTDASGNLVTPEPGNALGFAQGTGQVSGAPLSVSVTRAYDATPIITLDPGTWTVGGLVAGDVLQLSGATAATMADKTVGVAKPVTPDPGSVFTVQNAQGLNVYGYALPSVSATITPVTLTVSGLAAAGKVYDATPAATLASLGSVTPLAGDVVGLGGSVTAAFADKNVGTAKAVSVAGLQLTGADAGNYTLAPLPPVAADITALALPVGGLLAQAKVYDATTSATLAGTATVAPLGADVVGVAGTALAVFADKNVGTAKPVSVTGLSLTGADAANYTIVPPQGLSADITAATLALSGLTALNKVYDTTTAAVLSGTPTLAPALASDAVALAGTASGSFADKAAGTAKPVAVGGLSLTGADAGNYVIAPPALSADITAAPVVVTGLTALPKVYDATTAAPLAGTPTVAALGADVLAVAGTASGSFADKAVGTAKPVSVSGLTLAGADAANYVLVPPAGLSADVTAATLVVGGLAAQGKVYDATVAATLTGSPTVTPLGGDAVVLAGTAVAAFADKNAGLAKPVSVSGLSLAGPDAANYVLQAPTGLTATITQAPLAVTGLAAVGKVYDRTAVAALAGTPGVTPLAGDSVTLAGTATASFASVGVGTGKAVAVTGLSLAGTDAANYALAPPTGLTADITPRALSLAGVAAASRVYDAGTGASVSGSLVGVITGDVVGVALTGSFADAAVGSGKPVTATAALSGADAVNYTVAAPTGLLADITPATLRYVATPVVGTAGQPLPALTGSVAGLLGGDTLASATTGTLSWSTAATAGSPAGVYAVTGSGLSAANYLFTQDAANAVALTLNAATVSDPVTTVTTVVTTTALLSVSVPLQMSTPTEGRTLDVTPAFAGSVGAAAERRSALRGTDRPAGAAAAPGAAERPAA